MPQGKREPRGPVARNLGRDLLRKLVARPPRRLELGGGFRDAAVLIPFLPSGEVVFTVRSARLPHHSGQISFPGGMQEPSETPEAAALREAWEEIGLPPGAVEVLGRLDQTTSPFGFRITPVVGWIPHPPALSPNPEEVARILHVPFSELLEAPAWSEVREHGGRRREVWHYPWRGYDIWGVTGNIVHDLLMRYQEACA